MKDEVAAAVVFITRLIRRNQSLSKTKVEEFALRLTEAFHNHYRCHWYEEQPLKGQAYRCIRINEAKPSDVVLSAAATNSGLMIGDLLLPKELTLWVDPQEVCCRFGENQGSYCVIASFKGQHPENKASSINIDNILELAKRQRALEDSRVKPNCRTVRRSPVNVSPDGSPNASPRQSPHHGFGVPIHPVHHRPIVARRHDSYHWMRIDPVTA